MTIREIICILSITYTMLFFPLRTDVTDGLVDYFAF